MCAAALSREIVEDDLVEGRFIAVVPGRFLGNGKMEAAVA